jgi:NADH-quinone oxidoreductase subunit I
MTMKNHNTINVSINRPKGKYILPLLKGMCYTLRQLFTKPITIEYPEQKREVSKRWRGLHRLKTNDKGDLKCVACGLCVTICPPDAIKVVPYEDEGGRRYPKEFVIDEIRCIFCGFCAEACPMDAIELTKVYDYVDYNRDDFIFDITKLKTPEKFIFKGK